MLLYGKKIALRAMEPSDAELMYCWENDTRLWSTSNTTRPFSRAVINDFIAGSSLDIYTSRQLRLMMVESFGGGTVGCVDLFDFDPFNRRAGVGVLIYQAGDRRRGFAHEAIELLCDYALGYLGMEQLWADVPVSNVASERLFRASGFECSARRCHWIRKEDGQWEDVLFFQRFAGQ